MTTSAYWQPKVHGGSSKFIDPADFQRQCIKYFEWAEANPLFEEKAFQFQGAPVMAEITKPRVFTVKGLCLHLGITTQTWDNYAKREGYDEVVAWAGDVIYTQKFELAAVDLCNASFIAKSLGLADKVETSGTVTNINYSPVDYKRAQQELEGKLDGLD